jgi:hypothetical protein
MKSFIEGTEYLSGSSSGSRRESKKRGISGTSLAENTPAAEKPAVVSDM